MKKKPIMIVLVLIISSLAGCTTRNSSDKYSYYDWDFYYEVYNESDFVFYPESAFFDFTDAVSENGSVSNTTKIIIPLIIENRNDYFEIDDIDFEITEFPTDLEIWSTSLFLIDVSNMTFILYKDYDFEEVETSYNIPPKGKTVLYLVVQLDKTIEKTYSDNERYVCHMQICFEASYEVYSPHRCKTIGFIITT